MEVFENHRREETYRKILQILDVTRMGKLSDEEKHDARVIIYGISWGGSETVTLARRLQTERIPVLSTIPRTWLKRRTSIKTTEMLHGQDQTNAKDATRHANPWQLSLQYKAHSLVCEGYPWYDRMLTKFTRRSSAIRWCGIAWKG